MFLARCQDSPTMTNEKRFVLFVTTPPPVDDGNKLPFPLQKARTSTGGGQRSKRRTSCPILTLAKAGRVAGKEDTKDGKKAETDKNKKKRSRTKSRKRRSASAPSKARNRALSKYRDLVLGLGHRHVARGYRIEARARTKSARHLARALLRSSFWKPSPRDQRPGRNGPRKRHAQTDRSQATLAAALQLALTL